MRPRSLLQAFFATDAITEMEAEQVAIARRTANIRYLNRIGTPTTIVAVPSLSFSDEELRDIQGIPHYESRGLWQILAASDPNTKIIFVTSKPIPAIQIEHLCACHPAGSEILNRVTFLHLEKWIPANQGVIRPLADRLLRTQPALETIQELFRKSRRGTVLSPFVSSHLELKVAKALGIPLLGADESLLKLGNKSEGRESLIASGVPVAPGINNIYSRKQLQNAIAELWDENPSLRRLIIKLNEGVSGMGNAKLILPRRSYWSWRRSQDISFSIDRLSFEAPSMTLDRFLRRLSEIGGVVEGYVRGKNKLSPSAQGFVHPNGRVEIFSTHDQVLGGRDGNVFVGAVFPADERYRKQVQAYALSVGKHLAKKGVIGPYAVDFLAVPKTKNPSGGMEIYAIEINLRQGGTTHPYRTAKALCGAEYDPNSGNLIDINGTPIYYTSNDNIQFESLKGVPATEIVLHLEREQLLFDTKTRTGVVLHMLGAVQEWGKFGATIIAHDKASLERIYDRFLHTITKLAEQHNT